ncbi:MAG: aspartate aminotransferase family protein [Anaerolineales bacterium]|jgi:sphinganine-1-phosphate aldolase|nr:aspartate aminotransferase family protein [Anaerolineales bacterium]
MTEQSVQLPVDGKNKEEILATMQSLRQRDVQWRQGKTFSLVYNVGEEVADILKEAYTLFFSENALNPTAFPSLRRMEAEVVAMTAALLGGDRNVVGNMTSGGTESILMAVKTARDWARVHKPNATSPEMVFPATAHPAFEKAAHYFGVKSVRTPVGDDFRADVDAIRKSITPQTILIVGSAPSYAQGVVDPISELAKIALAEEILCHVDACVGGFMLPFVQRLGYPPLDFDFRVPGVTSMSADLHKYGYAAKGASTILYRDKELRRYQFFVYTDWTGGIYASPTMTGTRPGGAIAAAWAVMNFLGENGYLQIADTVMKTTLKLRAGIADISGISVLSDPDMSIISINSNEHNIYEIGDEMTLRGWHLDPQQFPASLHLTVNRNHADVADQFLIDLEASTAAVRRPSLRKTRDALLLSVIQAAVKYLPEKTVSKLMDRSTSMVGIEGSNLPQRSAPIYGMMGTLPNRADIHELVLDLIDKMTRLED